MFFRILNEKESNESSKSKKYILLEALVVCTHLTLFSFANLGQRILSKENLSGDELNFFISLFNFVPSFIVMLIQKRTGLTNIWYVLYSFN